MSDSIDGEVDYKESYLKCLEQRDVARRDYEVMYKLYQGVEDATKWIAVKDSLPKKWQYVLLLADRYWNTPDGVPDMKVTASGYLAEHGNLYWSVFGERGLDIDAFTHWMPIPDVDA